MNHHSAVRPAMSRGAIRYVVGIAVTMFLFSCSQNPVSISERASEPEAAAATTTPIHVWQVPPAGWNGMLVVYAHGFVPPGAPVAVQPESQQFATMAMSAGFAFATTSYPANGMVITEGLADLVTLVAEFKAVYPQTQKVLLLGVSMGGLIAAQAAERHPETFSGVLAMCGIYGNFVVETAHLCNFRVVFDYFFPGVIPGDAANIPMETMLQWQSVYAPMVAGLLADPANVDKVRQLLSVTKLPVDTGDPAAIVQSIIHMLTLNVYSTEDVKARLGGKPFGNRYMWYFGSDNDRALNAGVKRFVADAAALAAANSRFGTTGNIRVPVVTLHSTGDHIAPIVQQVLYNVKIIFARKTALYTGIPVTGFGHCTFEQQQIMTAFGALVAKVTGVVPSLTATNAAMSVCGTCK